MAEVGTLEWTRSTGGRLTSRERVSLLATGIASQLRQMSDRTAHALGLRKDRLARLDLAAVRPPDTAAAKAAERLADAFPPYMWHHSHRSYLWALALAKLDRLAPDEEVLYVACLMHDAGMFGIGEREPSACFTLGGAHAAGRCAEGWDESRRDRVMEAITLHINPVVRLEDGVEANLLTRGSTLDGIALRGAWWIHPETKDAVLARHPRHDMKRELPSLLRAHGREAPRCRIALYNRYGALPLLVRRAPWPD